MATNSTFSGTAVGSSGTLASLVTRILITLNDEGNATWDTEMIATFLNDGIRDYSQHFPRVKTDSISLTTDTAVYDLNADYMGILSVEYPDGEDPQEYSDRRPYTHPDFWDVDGYYDVIHHADVSDPSQVILSDDDVATGETAVIEYHAHHQIITDTASIAGANTVPVHHQQLLTKYVLWQAAQHLASAEQQTPTSSSSLLMAQLAQNARRLELSYATGIQQAVYAAEGESIPINWIKANSGMERVY